MQQSSRPSRRSLACVLLALIAACHGKPPPAPAAAQPAAAGPGLEITELNPGSGPAIAAGQTAVVNYTGWLYDAATPGHKGAVFDSSQAAGAPFKFRLGAGQVIKGWEQGVAGMKAGGRRLLTLPPELAYGDAGAPGVIPPGATLIFDVDLVAIE